MIRCTGCSLSVDVHDIEDPDNAVSKLTDLQDEYVAQKPANYPLISKLKANASFRPTMIDFFQTLIQTCHAAGLLYNDPLMIENIETWVFTMSSSGMRPFRHTATVISLAIGTELCRVATEIADNAAKTMRQKEGEQKKKTVNKERVKGLDKKIAELERKRDQIISSLKGLFDAVFVHRYRDVDPKIRVDCVTALGTWIVTLPDVFFDNIYLRHLGWVLSDTFSGTRLEVIKQLTKLFKTKENAARMRSFMDRFRSRLVEMAMQDSEVGVRVAAVELLDLIRETGLLEPDDIDNIGRLIFDTEVKVRKAVAGFFAENIQDLYDNSIEELGGEEGLAEALGEEVEDEYESPRISWLKLKCVAEALRSYDTESEEDAAITQESFARPLTHGTESRYALAAQTIYGGIPEAKEWEALAGYLLYDLSAADAPFEQRCQLTEKEELLLLEILNVAVKQRILAAVEGEDDKKGKRNKARRDESREIQESTALLLAKLIPDLLKKFGSNSATASAVLRLEHVLNLEIFQELRQDSTTYASLLDDINKQFLTHADQAVLVEASTALLHARSFEDLEEVTEGKVQELWDDTINALRSFMSIDKWIENIAEVCDTLRRIVHLASIMDCVTIFEAASRPSSKTKKKAQPSEVTSAFDMLLQILREPALDSEAGEEANEALISAMKALLFYYMWTVRSIQATKPPTEPPDGYPDPSSYSSALTAIIESRHNASSVRFAAIGTLLDLHTLFATFRHSDAPLPSLVQPIPEAASPLILSTFTALEKNFAKKAHKHLDPFPDDELDSEPEDSDDEDDEDETDEARTQQEALSAEQRLCELSGKIVLAILARVFDHPSSSSSSGNDEAEKGRVRKRLEHNKLKLGHNFKEVLAYLDGPKSRAKRGGSRKKPAKPRQSTKKAGQASKSRSKAKVQESEDSESDDGVAFEEGGDEDLRARELVEDRIEDPDAEEDVTAGRDREEAEQEDEDIMGD